MENVADLAEFALGTWVVLRRAKLRETMDKLSTKIGSLTVGQK